MKSLAPPRAREGTAQASILLAAVLAFFLPTLWGFREAWASPTYTHGYVVALATVWMTWRARHELHPDGSGVPSALAVIGLLSFLWLCATIASARSVAQLVLPALLLAWSAAVLGASAARRLAPIAAFALLAVPVWEVLVPPLQAMTTLVSGLMVRAVGVPAVITGNLVEIGAGSFIIADGCAGLSYLLAGLTIGALYAHLFGTGWATGARVMALAAALAIVGNWIRVASIIMIGHLTDMRSPLVEAHLTFGWAIFFAGLLAFFPLARRVVERGRRAIAAPTLPARAPLRTSAAAVATLTAVAGPLVFHLGSLLPTREPPPPQLAASAAWQARTLGASARPTAWMPAFGGAGEHVTEAWTDGPRTVVVDRLVYRGQAQGSELIGYGNRIAPDTALVGERLMGPVGARRRLVNEAIVREAEGFLLVWYWYRVGGRETESAARAKLLELWAFATLTRVSELITLSAPCDGGDCADASRTLTGFLGST